VTSKKVIGSRKKAEVRYYFKDGDYKQWVQAINELLYQIKIQRMQDETVRIAEDKVIACRPNVYPEIIKPDE
jgi:hypothetical protein